MDDVRFGDMPEDWQRERLSELADIVAADREHSLVSGSVFATVRAILDAEVTRGGVVNDERVVPRVLEELSDSALDEIRREWHRLCSSGVKFDSYVRSIVEGSHPSDETIVADWMHLQTF